MKIPRFLYLLLLAVPLRAQEKPSMFDFCQARGFGQMDYDPASYQPASWTMKPDQIISCAAQAEKEGNLTMALYLERLVRKASEQRFQKLAADYNQLLADYKNFIEESKKFTKAVGQWLEEDRQSARRTAFPIWNWPVPPPPRQAVHCTSRTNLGTTYIDCE